MTRGDQMKSGILFLALMVSLLITASAFAKDYLNDGGASGYQVGMVRPGGDRPCTLFTLVHVSEADAQAAPGTPWFVIDHNAPEYNQMVATLLAAKVSGRGIQVSTTGGVTNACGGHPTVSFLLML